MIGWLQRHSRIGIALILGIGILGTFGVCIGRAHLIGAASSSLHLPLLSSLRHLSTILSPDFMMFSEGQLRPGGYILLALARSFVDAEQVLFWHLLTIALHWLNGLLVALIVYCFTPRFSVALLAGLLFSLHPLATVVVDDIDQFHFLLGLSFLLAAFYVYLRSAAASRPRFVYGLSLAIFVVGSFVTKAVFMLPLLLAAHEGIFRRVGWIRALKQVGPFAFIPLCLAPLWWLWQPHPLHYTYATAAFPPGTIWFSFFSVISASEWYLSGLLLGRNIPLPLHEVVEQIYSPISIRLLIWGAVDLILLSAGLLLLYRKKWGGIGLVLSFVTMLPFASTAWNSVDDYVAWKYLYFPLAGLAMLVGWMADRLGESRRLPVRSLLGMIWIVLLIFAYQQIRLNSVSRSPLTHWNHVRIQRPSIESANVELGKAQLKQGDLKSAYPLLFAPTVDQLYASSTALCRYFTARDLFLPAAIHLRLAKRQRSGMQFSQSEPLLAELMYAAGAYDHAEAAFGKVLTANPYDAVAMMRLASVWSAKGYVRAADQLAERALLLDPKRREGLQIQGEMLEQRKKLEAGERRVVPPSPSWLRYASQGFYDSRIQDEIVRCSEQFPEDPVIQLEAGTCLVRKGEYRAALARFQRVSEAMPISAFAWAMRCWAAGQLGEFDEALAAGLRALELDNRNATVYNTLGILHGTLARQQPGRKELRDRAVGYFREALRINPQHVSARVNLAGELRAQGQIDEAEKLYRAALRVQPDLAEGHFNLGNLLAERKDFEGALRSYRQAIEARGDYAEAYYNMGTTLARQEEWREAQASFLQALEFQPDFSPARDALAVMLVGQNRFEQAIAVLGDGLRHAPRHTRGALMLASLLATCPEVSLRNGPAAVQIAERICRGLEYDHPEALMVLADAQAETGALDQAIATVQRAISLVEKTSGPSASGKLRQRLDFFRQLKTER